MQNELVDSQLLLSNRRGNLVSLQRRDKTETDGRRRERPSLPFIAGAGISTPFPSRPPLE